MNRMLLTCALIALPALAPANPYDALPCQCRDTVGNLVDVGEHACLTVNGRSFRARCAMSLNVTIWRETGEDCLTG